MTRPTIYFIRHGQTDWNVERRLQGQRDTPLNETGRGQARRNGRALAAHFAAAGIDPDSFDFVSSPLLRAATTMELARAEMGLDPAAYRTDPRLMEITFGAWEGYTLEELAAEFGLVAAAREADKWNYVPPGGESYKMLTERIRGWLGSVDRPTVAVSHGGVNRAFRGLLENLPSHEIPSLDVPHDRILRVEGGTLEWF